MIKTLLVIIYILFSIPLALFFHAGGFFSYFLISGLLVFRFRSLRFFLLATVPISIFIDIGLFYKFGSSFFALSVVIGLGSLIGRYFPEASTINKLMIYVLQIFSYYIVLLLLNNDYGLASLTDLEYLLSLLRLILTNIVLILIAEGIIQYFKGDTALNLK